MVVDRDPTDYVYISRRLTEEITHHDASTRPGWVITSVGTPRSAPIGAQLTKSDTDYNNVYLLAKMATTAVSDHTGTLGPTFNGGGEPTGDYLLVRMHLQNQRISLHRWEKAANHPIAAFVGLQRVEGVGLVFLGLVGSASNYIGSLGGGVPSLAWRTPSNADGLYDIIDQNRELEHDPALETDVLRRDASRFVSETEKITAAASLFHACKLNNPATLVEVLVKVNHRATDLNLYMQGPDGRPLPTMDLVILGAPVWVRSIKPWADRAALEERPAAHGQAWASVMKDEKWALFDSWLDGYLAVAADQDQHSYLRQWPPSSEDWGSFTQWFITRVRIMGPEIMRFDFPVASFSWTKFRRKFSYENGKASIMGWFVSYEAPRTHRDTSTLRGFGIFPDGRSVESHGSGTVAFNERLIHFLSGDDDKLARRVFCALRTLGQWRSPMVAPDQTWSPEISGDGRVAVEPTH